MPARSSLIAAVVLGALALPAAASAATWTQQSTIVNQTGSTFANCDSSVGGAGCMDLSAWSNNSGTVWTQQPQGQIPAALGSYDGSAGWGTANGVHGQPLQSEVQYLLPDQTTWVLDTDISYSGIYGAWTASCGVYQGQQSQYACMPTASGDSDLTTATYTFVPLGSETSVAAGESCGAELAGGDTTNCMATGLLKPWPAGSTITIYNPNSFAVNLSTNGMGTSCTAPAQGSCTVGTDTSGTPLIMGPVAGTPMTNFSVWVNAVTLVDPSESVVQDMTNAGGSGWLMALISDIIEQLSQGDDDGAVVRARRPSVAVKPSAAVRRTIAKAYGQPVKRGYASPKPKRAKHPKA